MDITMLWSFCTGIHGKMRAQEDWVYETGNGADVDAQ